MPPPDMAAPAGQMDPAMMNQLPAQIPGAPPAGGGYMGPGSPGAGAAGEGAPGGKGGGNPTQPAMDPRKQMLLQALAKNMQTAVPQRPRVG